MTVKVSKLAIGQTRIVCKQVPAGFTYTENLRHLPARGPMRVRPEADSP